MLKNQKVLSNNGKIMKGVHLESFIFYVGGISATMSIGMSGVFYRKSFLYIYV